MDLIKKNWQTIIFLGLWCGITFFNLFNHTPWYDEAHAWNIAQGLNFIEILDFMHIEGHTFLWYLCLMPFAKLNIGYPYSMLLINWLFCFTAILILWFKAPFPNWLKFLIAFSFPFLQYYPIVARCYSIGIMFLFLVAMYEKVKLKRPNLYAFLLVMLANTSVVALFGATILGALFLFELIKNKIKNSSPYLILIIGSGLILYQQGNNLKYANVSGFDVPATALSMILEGLKVLYKTNFILVLILVFIIILSVFYLKNKVFPTLLVFTTLCMVLMFIFIYKGFFWHKFFIYFYFITSLWILFNKFNNLKLKFIPITLLTIVSIMFIFWRPSSFMYNKVYLNNSGAIANFILKHSSLKTANLVAAGYYANTVGPYLRKENVDIKILCSGFSYNSYPQNWYFCGMTTPLYIYLDKFYDENTYSDTYFLLYKETLPNLSSIRIYSQDKKNYYDLVVYANLGDVLIYKFRNAK